MSTTNKKRLQILLTGDQQPYCGSHERPAGFAAMLLMAAKNLGYGKDAVLAQRLHGGNTRNRARAVLFSFSQVPPPSTIDMLSCRCHAPLRGLSYLYICDTSSNFNLNNYDTYDNFTTFGNL